MPSARRRQVHRAGAARLRSDLDEARARLAALEASADDAWREALIRLARAVEFRDELTGDHINRMADITAGLGRALGLSSRACDDLRLAATLHDAGKVSIPDCVLRKPGPLTAEERRIIETHPSVGHALLTGSGNPLLELAATVAHTHHERWDGTGYPRRLAAEDIPLEGRIAAVADVFDALTSNRSYRPAFGINHALAIIRSGRGTQFDPTVHDALLACLPELLESLERDEPASNR